MAKSTADYFEEMARKIREDEKAERDNAALAKLAELETRVGQGGLSDEDREVLAWARDMRKRIEDEDSEDETEDKPKPKREPAAEEEETPKPKTRPGRKSGAAYSWWVDDDGQVFKLDTARVYSGADEPDEVEVPEKPKPEEDAA